MHYAAWQPVSSPRRKKPPLLGALPQDCSLEPLSDPRPAEAGIAARPRRLSRRARPPLSRDFFKDPPAPPHTTPPGPPTESSPHPPPPPVPTRFRRGEPS